MRRTAWTCPDGLGEGMVVLDTVRGWIRIRGRSEMYNFGGEPRRSSWYCILVWYKSGHTWSGDKTGIVSECQVYHDSFHDHWEFWYCIHREPPQVAKGGKTGVKPRGGIVWLPLSLDCPWDILKPPVLNEQMWVKVKLVMEKQNNRGVHSRLFGCYDRCCMCLT